jgi:hypothetical protein
MSLRGCGLVCKDFTLHSTTPRFSMSSTNHQGRIMSGRHGVAI